MSKKNITTILEKFDLDEETSREVEQLWEENLNRSAAAHKAKITKDLKKQYKEDMEKGSSSLNQFIEENADVIFNKFSEEVQELQKIKESYAKKMAEVEEKVKAENQIYLEAFSKSFQEILEESFDDLLNDTVAGRETIINELKEFRKNRDEWYTAIKEGSARAIEEIVEVKFAKEFDNLKEDLEAARRDNFGREIYEAFSHTFNRVFFDASDEWKKVNEEKTFLENSIAEATKAMENLSNSQTKELETLRKEKSKVEETLLREREITKYLNMVNGKVKEELKFVLEATHRKNFPSTFKNFLERHTKQQPVKESSNKNVKLTEGADNYSLRTGGGVSDIGITGKKQIEDIKRRAGIVARG